MKFNLPGLDTKTLSETGVDMTLMQIDGKTPYLAPDGEPVTIRLHGPDSAAYRATLRDQMRKRFMEAQSPDNAASGDTVEQDAIELLAAITIDWHGIVDEKGKPIPCTKENARALYAGFPVVFDQVETFVGNRANFLKAS